MLNGDDNENSCGGNVVCVYPTLCFLCSCSFLFFTAAHFHLAGRSKLASPQTSFGVRLSRIHFCLNHLKPLRLQKRKLSRLVSLVLSLDKLFFFSSTSIPFLDKPVVITEPTVPSPRLLG